MRGMDHFPRALPSADPQMAPIAPVEKSKIVLEYRPRLRYTRPMDISEKLRKLLALADRAGTPEEAANAFARAQELATKHRIELATINPDGVSDPLVEEGVRATDGKRIMGWKKKLAWGMDSLGVFVLSHTGSKAGTFTFAGKRSDVDTASYMYHAIAAQIERLAKQQAQGQGRRYANAFKMGAALTVRKRLKEQFACTTKDAKEQGANETALVLVKDAAEIAESWVRQDPDIRITLGKTQISNEDGLGAGRRAGHAVNIGGNSALGTAPKAIRGVP